MTVDEEGSDASGASAGPVSEALSAMVSGLTETTGGGFDYDDNTVAEYGATREPAWRSRRNWGGEIALGARRPEVLDDAESTAWMHDMKSWATWAIATFRVTRHFPPCWPEHPALVEELMALWLAWQQGWLPAKDATAPAQFLQLLDLSISRCVRLWQISCDPTAHKPSPAQKVGADGDPELHRWWGNDNYITQGEPR